MLPRLGTWERGTNAAVHLSYDAISKCWLKLEQSTGSPLQDLERDAGDFIARQVLDRDSIFFEGLISEHKTWEFWLRLPPPSDHVLP